MWIRRVRVFDCVKVEEACVRNALLEEGGVAIAAVIREEPGGAQRNDARRCGQFTVDILMEYSVQLSRSDEVGVERVLGGHGAP